MKPEDHPKHQVKPGYLRPLAAANYLAVGRSTIYELIRDKDLPIYKIGKAVLIKVSDLDAYVEKQLVTR